MNIKAALKATAWAASPFGLAVFLLLAPTKIVLGLILVFIIVMSWLIYYKSYNKE